MGGIEGDGLLEHGSRLGYLPHLLQHEAVGAPAAVAGAGNAVSQGGSDEMQGQGQQ